ncbi:MAG: hypothetical protein IKQ17_12160 [Kiritimatiellae bacterium]|nr:hypothetical protein [Kiritimatiellia bacterium]
MKKTIAAICAFASAVAVAGMNDLLISFSTPGPDKYADGSEVQVGECYSLVGTKADGTQDIVLNYQTKLAGKCSPVVYMVDEVTAANYTSWDVYLTDTRDFAKDGKPAGLDDNGQPKVKNVQAPVAASVASSGSQFASATVKEGIAAGAYDLAAADVPQPEVTGIKIVGANVVVTVANTRPFVGYTLVSGKDTTNFSIPAAEGVNGDLSGEIELVAPKKDGAQFFKVSTVK